VDIESLFTAFFGINFDSANGMRKSLSSVLKFAAERAKKGGVILAFSRNEFGSLGLAEFTIEWEQFVQHKHIDEPSEIESRITMLTEFPNVNESLESIELNLKKYHTTLIETLRLIRRADTNTKDPKDDGAARNQRRRLEKLVKRDHNNIMPENTGAQCQLRTMHLLELRWGKKDYSNAEKTADERILAYIEGCACKKTCLHAVVKNWGTRRPVSLAYSRFLAGMSLDMKDPEKSTHRLLWREKGCNEALVSLCKKGLLDRDKVALNEVAKSCSGINDVVAKKIHLLKTQVAPCDNDTIRAMEFDKLPLPPHSMQKDVDNLKDNLKETFSNWHTSIPVISDAKHDETLRGMLHLIELLDLTTSGRDIEGAGDLLKYVDISYVFTCGPKTRFEYLKSIESTLKECQISASNASPSFGFGGIAQRQAAMNRKGATTGNVVVVKRVMQPQRQSMIRVDETSAVVSGSPAHGTDDSSQSAETREVAERQDYGASSGQGELAADADVGSLDKQQADGASLIEEAGEAGAGKKQVSVCSWTGFMKTRAFANVVAHVPSNGSWHSLSPVLRVWRTQSAPPSSLQAYHWLTFSNEITVFSEKRPDVSELSSALKRLEPAFKKCLKRWEDGDEALFEAPEGADTSEIAQKYYSLLAEEENNGVNHAASKMAPFITGHVAKVEENEGGWTRERGVLQLWLFLDLELLCAIQVLVGEYEPYGTHVQWLLHRSMLRRRQLVDRALKSGIVSLDITIGDIKYIEEKNGTDTNIPGDQGKSAEVRYKVRRKVAKIMTHLNDYDEHVHTDDEFNKDIIEAERIKAQIEEGTIIGSDETELYRFLRRDLETYERLLTKGGARVVKGGIKRMLEACQDIGAVPAYFQLMKVTRLLNKQPSKLREFIEASELDENQKRIMLESSTVEEADKALLEYENQKMRFGGKADELIKEFINEIEERQERPKTQKINKLTPIATGRAGFITLAFFGGGLYQILSGGTWIRVLAGAYGDEAYSHAAGFYYTAQTLMVLRGAAHETSQDGRQDGRQMGRPMGRRMRRDLGISIFESRVKSDVVAAMMHEKDKARSVSRLLWRLPCDAPCGSIVYLCCDDAPLKRGTARSSAIAVIDVLTLVVDAETSRLLERHVARDFEVTKDDGGVERRKKRKGVLNEIKRFAAAVRDDNVGDFEIELKRSDRSLDTKTLSPKFKPHIVQNHMKGLTRWRVFVPEIGLLWCFPRKLRKDDETRRNKIAEEVARSLVETAGIRIKHEDDARNEIKARLEKLDELLTKRKEGEGADA
jgi:hypothetical protein